MSKDKYIIKIEDTIKGQGRVAIFSSPKKALKVLSRLAKYSEFLRGE